MKLKRRKFYFEAFNMNGTHADIRLAKVSEENLAYDARL